MSRNNFFYQGLYDKVVQILSITGTPGTGKTTVALYLRKMGYKVYDLNEYLKRKNLFEGWDEKRESNIVDIDKLPQVLEGEFLKGSIVEGHISHYLNPFICIVLRTKPGVLLKRLKERGYSNRKAKENAEAEALGIISGECINLNIPSFEIDTTYIEAREVVSIIEKIYNYHFNNKGHIKEIERYTVGWVDYLPEVLTWY